MMNDPRSPCNKEDGRSPGELPPSREESHRVLVETLPHGIAELDRLGCITYCNAAYGRMFGYAAADLRGMEVVKLLAPGMHRDAFAQYLATMLAQRSVATPFYAQHVTKDGRTIEIQADWSCRCDEQGTIVGFVVGVTDISAQRQVEQTLRRVQEELELRVRERTADLARTIAKLQAEIHERVHVERALRQQSRHLDAFFEHSLTPIAFLDREFNFLRVNAAYARADRKRVDEYPGRNHFELYPSEENRAIFAEVVQTKAPAQVTAKPFVYPDHPERGVTYSDWSLVPLLDDLGEVELLVFSLRDVTAWKQAELELQALNESLRQQAGQLRRLTAELTLAEHRERRRMAQVLHDHLQQLLVAARLKTTQLRHGGAGDIASLEELDALLEQSIEESRMLTVEFSPPVLYDTGLVAALDWLSRQMIAKHGLQVDMLAKGDCEPIAEDVRVIVFQAVRELLINVVKHAQTSSARIELTRGGDGSVEIAVTDGGCGFDPQQYLSQKTAASGFGLFSVRERLELLGGRMAIVSAPGQGTQVHLVVPSHQMATFRSAYVAGDLGEGLSEETRSRRTGSTSGDLRRVRILLADDHRIFREGLVSLLSEESDIEIVGQAADGHEAIELARQLRPDVILMDITMPRLDGVGATRQIHKELPEVCIIGLSMHDEDLGQAIHMAGAQAYLSKHGPSDELLATIRRCVARLAKA